MRLLVIIIGPKEDLKKHCRLFSKRGSKNHCKLFSKDTGVIYHFTVTKRTWLSSESILEIKEKNSSILIYHEEFISEILQPVWIDIKGPEKVYRQATDVLMGGGSL